MKTSATPSAPIRWQPEVLRLRQLGSGFSLIFRREWAVLFANKADLLNPMLFFLMATAVLPLTLEVGAVSLSAIVPGIIWLLVLFSFMISADLWLKIDFEQGFLSQWVLSPYPLFMLVLGKVFAHWLAVLLSILLVLPLVSLIMGLSVGLVLLMGSTLVLGTLAMSLVCAFSAALTLGLRQSGILLVLIGLPLNIPLVVFGAGVAIRYTNNEPFMSGVWLLVSITFGWLALMPFIIAAAIRFSEE